MPSTLDLEQPLPGLTCLAEDTLAERLRRRPAKPMGSPRVGSNPTGVDVCEKAYVLFPNRDQGSSKKDRSSLHFRSATVAYLVGLASKSSSPSAGHALASV